MQKKILLIILAALLGVLSFPPFSFGTFLGFAALAPLFIVLLGETNRRRGFWWGFLFGLVFVGGTLSWIWSLHPLDWLGFSNTASLAIVGAGYLFTVAYLALFFGLSGWLVVLLKTNSWKDYFIIPAALIVADFLRSLGPLGFPPSLADSQFTNLPILQITEVTGKWGVTAILVLTGLFIARSLSAKKILLRELTIVVFILSATLAFGWWRMNYLPPVADEVKVAIFQGNNERYFAENEAVKRTEVAKYEGMLAGFKEPFDLAVLPESAVLLDLRKDKDLRDRLTGNLSPGQTLLLGLPLYDVEPTGRLRTNSAIVFDNEGEVLSRYDKNRLILIREYLPPALSTLATVIGADELAETLSTEAVPGGNRGPIETGHGKSAVLICFESIFPALSRRQVKEGAEWITIITNDAWFKRSAAAAQHNSLAALRAVETRRWVVRAANTGISSVFDPTGREIERTNLFEQTVLPATIEKRTEQTFYVRFGEWMVLLSGLVLVGRAIKKIT